MSDAWAIVVWRFLDAPEEFQRLSTHGGDEDWLAIIPSALAGSYIGWCDPYINGPFGVCEISEHPLDDGRVVRIGAHA